MIPFFLLPCWEMYCNYKISVVFLFLQCFSKAMGNVLFSAQFSQQLPQFLHFGSRTLFFSLYFRWNLPAKSKKQQYKLINVFNVFQPFCIPQQLLFYAPKHSIQNLLLPKRNFLLGERLLRPTQGGSRKHLNCSCF